MMTRIAKMFKKGFIGALMIAALVVAPMAAQAQTTLNLKADWAAVSHNDLTGYYFYWNEDGVGTVYRSYQSAGVWGATASNPTALPLSPCSLNYPVTIPDTPVTGTLRFGIRSFDGNGNLSAMPPTIGSFNFNIDTTPPPAPATLTITKQ